MDTVMPWVLMIAMGVFVMAQQAYYKKRAEVMDATRERDLMNAESDGRLNALNDPKAVMQAYHKMFTYTMN